MIEEPGFWGRLAEVFLFRAGYNVTSVVIGVGLLGLAAGAAGTFLVQRRRALLSDALSHATLPGIVLAFLAGSAAGIATRSLPLLLAGAALSALAGVLAINAVVRFTRLREDAAIGIVLSVFFAVGIVMMTYAQGLSTGGQAGLKSFIFGQAAALTRAEAVTIGLIAAGVVAAIALLFKELAAVAFDEDFSAAIGLPVARLDLILALLVGIVTIVGLQAAGLVLVIALIIIPPVAARFWSDRLSHVAILSAAFGAASALIGAALSYAVPNAPTGATIVLTAAAFALLSLLLAPRRGLLAASASRGFFRFRLARLRLLAAIGNGENLPPLPADLRLALRLEGLLDGAGRPTEKARAASGPAARRLALWQAALSLPDGALPRRARWGIDDPAEVLPPDLLDLLEKRAAS